MRENRFLIQLLWTEAVESNNQVGWKAVYENTQCNRHATSSCQCVLGKWVAKPSRPSLNVLGWRWAKALKQSNQFTEKQPEVRVKIRWKGTKNPLPTVKPRSNGTLETLCCPLHIPGCTGVHSISEAVSALREGRMFAVAGVSCLQWLHCS